MSSRTQNDVRYGSVANGLQPTQKPEFSKKIPEFYKIPLITNAHILNAGFIRCPIESPAGALKGYVGSFMDIQLPEIEIYVSKVEAAWTALQHQYASRITEAEIDHLFACFVLGLTSPAYAEQAPELHFEVCRTLAAMKLPPDRTEAALHSVPESTEPWVVGANLMIERQGAKVGRTLRKLPDFNDGPAADADSMALSRPGSSEDKAA